MNYKQFTCFGIYFPFQISCRSESSKYKPNKQTGKGNIQLMYKIKKIIGKDLDNQEQAEMVPSDIKRNMFVWEISRKNEIQT